jgi:hypothetical protein
MDNPHKEFNLARYVTWTLAAFGMVFTILAGQVEFGTPATPGPGLWPTLTGVTVMMTCTVVALRPKHLEAGAERLSRTEVIAVGRVLLGVALFIPSLILLGFVPAIAIASSYWFKIVEGESWKPSIIYSVGFAVVLYGIFVVVFSLPFPTGALINW